MSQTLNPKSPCAVTMSAEEWQNVLAVLREAPYKVVAPLIDTIVNQCIQQSMSDARANRTVEP